MTYLAEIDSKVAGIPCRIGITHFYRVRGSYSYNAESDMDYYGYSDSDWEVLDRRGRPATWLERKLTKEDRQRIEEEIEKTITEEAY